MFKILCCKLLCCNYSILLCILCSSQCGKQFFSNTRQNGKWTSAFNKFWSSRLFPKSRWRNGGTLMRQQFSAGGLGAAKGYQQVKGSALVGGPGRQSPPEAPENIVFYIHQQLWRAAISVNSIKNFTGPKKYQAFPAVGAFNQGLPIFHFSF